MALLSFLQTWFNHRLTARRDKYKYQVEGERDDAKAERERARDFREREANAATQMSSEAAPVRRAGLHAMAQLADEWDDGQARCVDHLCSYLRHPWDRDTDKGEYEVRRALVTLFRDHLRGEERKWGDYPRYFEPGRWSGLDFDFGGATFAQANFDGCIFQGNVDFSRATFAQSVSFNRARFLGTETMFDDASFLSTASFHSDLQSDRTTFNRCVFEGEATWASCTVGENSSVDFSDAEFRSKVSFEHSHFRAGADFKRVTFFNQADFADCIFSGVDVGFQEANFRGHADFIRVRFQTYATQFDKAVFHGTAEFSNTKFTGSRVGFYDTQFLGDWTSFWGGSFDCQKCVHFMRTDFAGDIVQFDHVDFCQTPYVVFVGTQFLSQSLTFGPFLEKVDEVDFKDCVFPLSMNFGLATVRDVRVFFTAAQPPADLSHVHDDNDKQIPHGIRHPNRTPHWSTHQR